MRGRIILIFSVLFLQSALVTAQVIDKTDTISIPKAPPDTFAIPDTITITAVGDIMLGTNFPSPSYLPPSVNELLAPARVLLESSHLTFGNLEGTILDSGGKPKTCSDPSLCYLFRMPESYTSQLQQAGFDVVSIANNHSGDFGEEGRKRTVSVLEEHGVACCGLISNPYTIVVKDGIRFGITAFAPNSGTLNLNDSILLRNTLNELRPLCDILIVSFHGGAEGRGHQHVPRINELFYGENRGNVYSFARKAIDGGADIVIGHGPHVVRAVDMYKGKFIAYSLGNFCTYSRFNLSGENGYAPLLKVFVGPNGDFLKAEIHSFIQTGEGGPMPDEQLRAYKAMRSLTNTDIPEAELIFDENGMILPKPSAKADGK